MHYTHQHQVNAWRLLGQEIVNNAAEPDWFGGDEEARELQGRELGRKGALFMKAAGGMERQGGKGGGVLFEDVFSTL